MTRTILVTGGAGFVGSNLALAIKRDNAGTRVVSLDNLCRRGSEFNLPRLAAGGVEFVFGDVRCRSDVEAVGKFHDLIECSAEPSALAGYGGSPEYLIQTNLIGAYNCLEAARRHDAGFVFLSTSRVYPSALIDGLAFRESDTRYELADVQSMPGASSQGISEDFPLIGARTLYGATKLAAELLITEYADAYNLRAVINRCGVIAGPWQMGKVDQGFVVYWVARHLLGGGLTYLGYEGSGKQVRDILHVDDLSRLVQLQIGRVDELKGEMFNVGGGRDSSISLLELTTMCQRLTGRTVSVESSRQSRRHDLRIYISDCRKLFDRFGWRPMTSPQALVSDVATWINDHRELLSPVLSTLART